MLENQKKLFLDYESSLSLFEAGILFTKDELSGYWRKGKHIDCLRLILEEPIMKAIFPDQGIFPDDEITDWRCDNCKGRIEHEDFIASINKDTGKGIMSCECSNWITDSSKKALANAEGFVWDGFIIGKDKIIPAPDIRLLWSKIDSVITKENGETYEFDIIEVNHTSILCGYYDSSDCWMDFYGNIDDPKTPAEILHFAHVNNESKY